MRFLIFSEDIFRKAARRKEWRVKEAVKKFTDKGYHIVIIVRRENQLRAGDVIEGYKFKEVCILIQYEKGALKVKDLKAALEHGNQKSLRAEETYFISNNKDHGRLAKKCGVKFVLLAAAGSPAVQNGHQVVFDLSSITT